MNEHRPTSGEPDDPEPLARDPRAGQLPSDTDVQAERQEQGVEAEYDAELRDAARRSKEPIHHVEGGDIGDGAD
jgi:hypothetical protein